MTGMSLSHTTTHRGRWLSLLGLATLFGVIMAAGCSGSDSGDHEPAPPPLPSSMPSPSPSPSPTPAPLPTPTPVEDRSAPYVTATSPKLGTKSVAPNTTIAAQLSKPLAAETVNEQTVKVQDIIGNTVPGTVSADTLALSVQFTPTVPFTAGETYVVILSTAITDTAGNPLAQPYAWSFEVTPPAEPPPPPPQDTKAPFVTGSSPTLGDVVTSEHFGKAITFTFSEPLAANSVTTQTVHLSDASKADVAGAVTLDASGTTISFTPSPPLHDSETYTVTLDTGITDLAANAMTYPYATSFKTSVTTTDAIAVGWSSLLALKKNGTVWGWGQNNLGQLGDGTQIDRNRPTRTVIDDVIAISQGRDFSIALRKDGTVWAWGNNIYGQMGDGTPTSTPRLLPAPIPNLTDVKAISATASSAIALKKDGTLMAWGYNGSGQTGSGTTASPQPTPVEVKGISGTIIAIATGGSSAAALVQSDAEDPASTSIWAWGGNSYGQLGDGTTTTQSLPVQVKLNNAPITNIAKIAYGEGTLAAITNAGDLYTWGSNRYGQIGNPALSIGGAASYSPSATMAMSNAKSVFMGPQARSIIVEKTDGSLWGWGNDGYGQLATTILIQSGIQATPMQLGVISNMKDITTNIYNGLYLSNDGSLFSTGNNLTGQLGDGSATFASTRPYLMSSIIPDVKSISGTTSLMNNTFDGDPGHDSAVIVDGNSNVWAWGGNQYCEMGDLNHVNQTQSFMALIQVAPGILKNITQVSRGSYHVLALDDTGHVWAWGRNNVGQLGRGTKGSTTPPLVPMYECTPAEVVNADGTKLSNVASIAATWNSSFAIKTDGTVYGWGNNYIGTGNGNSSLGLGPNDTTAKVNPVPVPELNNKGKIAKITSGSLHTLALTEDGKVYGWGANSSYEAGDGSSKNGVYTPIQIDTDIAGNLIGKVADVCSGLFHTTLLKEDGTLLGFGNNPGYLGTVNTANPVPKPSPVTGITDTNDATKVVKVACDGGRNTLALTQDHRVWAWGPNNVGQIGQGNTINYSTAQLIPTHDGLGILNDVTTIGYNTLIRGGKTFWKLGYVPEGEPTIKARLVPVLWP